jgi:hypothetical protein
MSCVRLRCSRRAQPRLVGQNPLQPRCSLRFFDKNSLLQCLALPTLVYDFAMLAPIDRNAIPCCSTCCCLGFRTGKVRARLRALSGRSFEGFELSANHQGCSYCAVALQSFLLFKEIVSNMQVELLLYPNSPTEMHSMPTKGQSEVLEIYSCPSKHPPAIPTFLVALTEYRTFGECGAVMVKVSQRCATNIYSTSVHTVSVKGIPNMHFRA